MFQSEAKYLTKFLQPLELVYKNFLEELHFHQILKVADGDKIFANLSELCEVSIYTYLISLQSCVVPHVCVCVSLNVLIPNIVYLSPTAQLWCGQQFVYIVSWSPWWQDCSSQWAHQGIQYGKKVQSTSVECLFSTHSLPVQFGHKFNPVYQRFCVNYEKQQGFVRALQQLPDFQIYQNVCRGHSVVGKNDLAALLIAPMQHQCRYQLKLDVRQSLTHTHSLIHEM